MWKCLPEICSAPCDESKLQNKDGVYFHATQNLQRHDAVNRKFMKTEEDTALAKQFMADWNLLIQTMIAIVGFYRSNALIHMSRSMCRRTGKQSTKMIMRTGKDRLPYHHVTEEESLARHYRYKYAELLELCDKYLGKLLDKFDELDNRSGKIRC